MGMRNANPGATRRARTLRRCMPNTQRRLWVVIRRRALGWRFRREFPIGPFILDFYCPALRLAIEVDGTQHTTRLERDTQRDQALSEFGILTIRFRTLDVIENLEGVYARLERLCRERAEMLGCLEDRRRDQRRVERRRARRKAPPP